MRIMRVPQAMALTLVTAGAVNFAFANFPISGAGFHALRPADVNFIQFGPSGVWNNSSTDYHYVMGDLSTMTLDVNTATTRYIRVKGRNYGMALTCWAYFVRTWDGMEWSGAMTTTTNGTFVMDVGATIGAGNQWQEIAVQLQCGLPPWTTSSNNAPTLYSAL